VPEGTVFDALLSQFSEHESDAAARYLLSSQGLGVLIRAGTEAGFSGRQILADYREFGGEITNASYWNLRQTILSGTQPPFGKDYASLISGHDFTETEGGREGLYQLNFRVYVQHTAESGLPSYSVMHHSMTQRDLDVVAGASRMGDLMDYFNDETGAYGRWIGFEISSVTRYTG
jgi:hypothetical protein